MQVKNIMTKEVQYLNKGSSIVDAARRMRDKNCGSIPIEDGDKLVGMLTDRDIVMKVVSEGKDPKTTTVQEVMTPQILYCYEDDSCEECAKNMARNKIRRLPVMNSSKRLVGIVTLGDLAVRNSASTAQDAHKAICQP
jgi:CBS domain-containing protein